MTTNGNGHLPIYELARLFPPMSDEEYAGLKADIAANGVQQAIAVWQGQVIDGLHRYQACEDLGIKAPLLHLADDVDPVAFVLSANMSRRQLSKSQKMIIVAQLPGILKGSNQHQHVFDTNNIKVGTELFFTQTQAWTVQDRATIAGVDPSYQLRADAIVKYGDDDVTAVVQSGHISVEDAYHAVNAARKAKAQAEKAERARVAAEAAKAAEREAAEKARAELEAAEERARAEREAAKAAEREAAEKARVELEAPEEREAAEKSRAEREAAEERAKVERKAEGKARAAREAAEERARAEREVAEAAEREAEDKARAEQEAAEGGNRCRPAGGHREGQCRAGGGAIGSRPATDGRRPHIDQIGLRCKGTAA